MSINLLKMVRNKNIAGLLLLGIAVAGCGSDKQNTNSSDSLITDTSMIDTTSTDSAVMVDSAVNKSGTGMADTSGGGAGTPRQP